MIYELSTLTSAPSRLKEVIDAVNAAAAQAPAELVAAWVSEVGQINDVLVLRRYADGGQANEVKPGGGNWLDAVLPLLSGYKVETYRLLPGMPAPTAGAHGAIHEMRTYVYRPGMLDELIATWTPPLLKRVEISPAPLVMYSVGGHATKFIHLWVYPSYEERLRIRAGEVAKGTWPPPGGKNRWLSQENALLVPLACSPMK
jgi:hypothetical protein